MAEKAVTRTKGDQHGGLQLFPILRTIKGEALAAGSEEAQKEFLNIMGFTVANIPMEEVDFFTDEEAEEITVALSHFQCNDEALIDPYFTPNEWERHFKRARMILSEIRELNETELAKDSIREKCDELPVQCKCRVHTALKMDWVLEISEPMNDSDGLGLAKCLIPEILKRGGGSLPSLKVEECRPGTDLKVEYILRLPSGQSVYLAGWPDFSILYKLTPTCIQRKTRRLYGVGEVQSKPATKSNDNKTATMAQAGIYGVGELTKFPHNHIVVIILFKDKLAQVALASRGSTAAPMSGGLGAVSYKYIESTQCP